MEIFSCGCGECWSLDSLAIWSVVCVFVMHFYLFVLLAIAE